MTWAEAQLAGCITEGLFALRKLQGDTSVYGPDNRDALQALVSQGRRAEGLLRREGSIEYIQGAYERAGVNFVEEDAGGQPGALGGVEYGEQGRCSDG